MSNIFVVGDYHFCHDKEFLWGSRGFSSIEEHDQTLIEHHNFVVKPEDIVYCLGDIMLQNNEKGMENFSKLNGHFYIAIGNHDSNARIELYKQYMESPTGIARIEDIQFAYRIRYMKKELYLSHYPTIVDNGEDQKPVFNIHAHTHSKEHFSNYPKCYCASIDSNRCFPILLPQVILDIKQQNALA